MKDGRFGTRRYHNLGLAHACKRACTPRLAATPVPALRIPPLPPAPWNCKAQLHAIRDWMPPSTLEVLHSYRHIYRTSLQSVQYSSPARHVLRKLVNNAYRNNGASNFDAQRIKNTLTFLQCAAKERGLEHKLQKTLIHTWWSGGSTKTMRGE